ncbi:MAG: hypothetical protein ACI9JN_000476 [Bacteroidia bacterium]|jgi:hypothetical protein
MKTQITLIVLLLVTANYVSAQNQRLIVTNIESNLTNHTNAKLTSFAYNYMSYHANAYDVVNEKRALLIMDSIKTESSICDYICVRQMCQRTGINWALSAEIKEIAGRIYVITKMINKDPSEPNKVAKMDFLNLPEDAEFMIKLTLQKLLNIPHDKNELLSLTDETNTSSGRLPNYQQSLNLSGPRLGYTVFTGPSAKILRSSRVDGGYDLRPGFINIGYQFEQQYLHGGSYQGLIEIIPQISGLDQGLFLPSLTVLNGLRNARSGLEFAFGPTFNVAKKEQKYQENGIWYRPQDRSNINELPIEDRLDSRGSPTLTANLVFAIGKSFQAGTMNVPVNFFFVPNKDDYRYGISIGYNFKR